MVTQDAIKLRRKFGTVTFLDQFAKKTKLSKLIVVHTDNDNVAEIYQRMLINKAAFVKFLNGRKFDSNIPMTFGFSEANILGVNHIFNTTCEIDVLLRNDNKLYVTATTGRAVPKIEYCLSYMYILAVNGLVVRDNDHSLIALLP